MDQPPETQPTDAKVTPQPLVSLRRAAVHLIALSSLAIAWKFLEPLSSAGDFFIERDVRGMDLVLFALVLVLLIPALMILIEWVAGLVDRRLRTGLHLAFVAGFVGLAAWQELHRRLDIGPATWLLALATAAGTVWLYARRDAVRSFFSFLGVAPVAVLVAFFVFSPNWSLAFGGKGSGPVKGLTAQAPVVWITLDEFPLVSLLDRKGGIDRERYPNFARLADTSTWYRNMTSVSDYTHLAVPALLSGTEPDRRKLPVAADYPDTLFRLLGGSYHLDVTEFATRLCDEPVCRRQAGQPFGARMRQLFADSLTRIKVLPPAVRDPLAQRLAVGERPVPAPDRTTTSIRRKIGGRAGRGFSSFFRTLRPSDGRTLNYLHAIYPHRPWDRLPTGQGYRSVRRYTTVEYGRWPDDPRVTAIAYQRHLLQVASVDHAMGVILDRLEAVDLLDRALVVVVADHGASFKAGERARSVTPGNVEEIAAVPLIVKAPGQAEGRVEDSPVDSTDVLPIVADELGVRLPWKASSGGGDRATVTVRRATGGGGALTVARAEFERRLRAAVGRKAALFGSGADRGLYAVGGHAELLGRAVTALPAAPATAATATLDQPLRYRAVRPEAPFIPAEITGRIRSAPGGAQAVAIAVNGRIAATAPMLGAGRNGFYSAVVPPDAFRPGANAIGVYAVTGPLRAPRLQPLLSR